MFYYKLYNDKGIYLGMIDSFDFRYYNEASQRILGCNEALAQYVYFNGQMYRIYFFREESDAMKGTYPDARIELISQEEYEKEKLV